MSGKKRCSWCLGDRKYQQYHDNERGIPVHKENKHFEMLILETMQGGLNRRTILYRREGYRKVLDNFNYKTITTRGPSEIEKLMKDSRIIRNRRKIESIIINAKTFLSIQSNFGSFDSYIWGFTQGKTISINYHDGKDQKITSTLSDTISADMKKHGFQYIGSITVHAWLQAIGIINGHHIECFRLS